MNGKSKTNSYNIFLFSQLRTLYLYTDEILTKDRLDFKVSNFTHDYAIWKLKYYLKLLRGLSFSTCIKFSEKLTFLNP